jgi:hypothetical protein
MGGSGYDTVSLKITTSKTLIHIFHSIYMWRKDTSPHRNIYSNKHNMSEKRVMIKKTAQQNNVFYWHWAFTQ